MREKRAERVEGEAVTEASSAPAPEEDVPDRPEGEDPSEASGAPVEPALRSALEEVGELKTRLEREKKKRKKLKEKAKAGIGTSRGIETMFRTSYRTHIDLSALADNKANIMISINGIIISLLLLIITVAPTVANSRSLLLPTAVLLVGCLVSIVYAVVSARPRVSSHVVSLDDVREGRSNILFFGNFVTMSEDDFVQGMRELMQDTEEVYINMTRDLHSLGGVLDRKFRLLRISYNVFMAGLVVGVVLFLAMIGTTLGTGGP